VKVGWLYGGGNFYKASGLYLFDGKVASKLDTGLIYAGDIAVAPDGCKAAVKIDNHHLQMGGEVSLKVFDFCAGGHER
jgi:hypothetical protein